MPETTPPARLVLTTTSDAEEAGRIARVLVEEGLIACATMVPGAQSIYRWEGKIESASETLMLMKTGPDQLEALEARLHALHSYETPEFLVLCVDAGSRRYLDWLDLNLVKF